MPKKLAIIGAGPKGVAIAAKAAILRSLGLLDVDVTVFDPSNAGASWDGRHGYTDGEQPLCTPPERDLGFPYEATTFGPKAASTMYAQFSWHTFCVEAGAGPLRYADWISRGQRRPKHKEFAKYLVWALAKATALHPGVKHVPVVVRDIAYSTTAKMWELRFSGLLLAGTEQFNGVVVTGSGTPLQPPLNPTANPRLFDGKDFWQRQKGFLDLLDQDDNPSVVIIGSGGTAAAICAHLVRSGISPIPIYVIGGQPTLFARTPNHLEGRLFSDVDSWVVLSNDSRREFMTRLNQGAVWNNVIDVLGDAENIAYRCGYVWSIRQGSGTAGSGPPSLEAMWSAVRPPAPGSAPLSPPPVLQPHEGTVFVDARGFDAWGFVARLDSSLRPHFTNRQAVEESIDGTLAVAPPIFPHPGLHLPMHGWLQGPGSSNLMALGWMADSILRRY